MPFVYIIYSSKLDKYYVGACTDLKRRFLTDSKLNEVAGGSIDLQGSLKAAEKLFSHDIAGLYVQYVKNLRINDFGLQWENTRMPFYTHGIELNHFGDVKITDFKGAASPMNRKKYRIYAANGNKFATNDKEQIRLENIK